MSDNTLVEKIIEYIEKNLETDLSLDKISKDLCYSKFYIAKVFLEKTNCTIYKYIQGRRLTLAASKLVETDKTIIEIAYEAQYGSQQAFNYAFRKLYLCTPHAYRKKGFSIRPRKKSIWKVRCFVFLIQALNWEVKWLHEYNSLCH